MNQTSTLLILFIVLVVAAVFLFLWRRRDASGGPGESAAPPSATPRSAPPPSPLPHEGHGLADAGAAATADVAGQFLGVDAHADGAPGDELTLLKGLGPKAAAQLRALGVTRYAQIASWGPDDVAQIDSRMGAFKGRIVRDQWVEQATHLSIGDTRGFEQRFGKLGG